MRLIGTLATEKQAFVLYSYLLTEGIHATYEKEKGKEEVEIWIYEEDQVERAAEILNEYKSNPNNPIFANVKKPSTPPQPPDLIAQQKEEEAQKQKERLAPPGQGRAIPTTRKARSYPFTYGIILACILLFMWDASSKVQMLKADGKIAAQIGLTRAQQLLLFDYTKSAQAIDAFLKEYSLKGIEKVSELPAAEKTQLAAAQNIPKWEGLLAKFLASFGIVEATPAAKAPTFEQIREGEVWRLFSPALLHGGLLHLIFNMAWAWLLLRLIEERLPKWKMGLLVILIGIVANISQYVMSGPFFLGFSGVVCGLVGFIWVRQKIAPWEGYPLQRSTFLFILVYVAIMFGIELFSLIMAFFSKGAFSPNIANTAHIVGGLFGALLGRVPLFSRGMQ